MSNEYPFGFVGCGDLHYTKKGRSLLFLFKSIDFP